MRSPTGFLIVAALLAVAACSEPSRQAFQPAIYCYQSLAAVTCLDEPYFRDEKRLVNYLGPSPVLYPIPVTPQPILKAPAPVDYWVKDTEPIPRPAR
jgi:hypothetical protein